jgi:benzoyl-CoA reductase/2-hydroxyglutaryl-CoA dehydratase subunit BcrC/BadD/HgdB
MSPRYIGITSTVPVEIVYAAGAVPVDLNNAFITAADPQGLIDRAERDGFARNYCAWIKGIYGALQARPEINEVIGVNQGDCSNTAALLDLLSHRGITTYAFAYPGDRDEKALRREMEKLGMALGSSDAETARWRTRLNDIRALAWEIDRLTWEEDRFSGEENHLALIDSTDFTGDPDRYENRLETMIRAGRRREPLIRPIRLGLVGVPPIPGDIFALIESLGAGVVYNEVQREFTLPRPASDLVEQYQLYTYPYGANYRAQEIARQTSLRGLNGLIHYVQSFCYHQLDDIIIRETAGVPVLTLEADKPGPLDARARLRLEAFIETISSK